MERYGLTGYPLGHTLSPPIHARLFALEGIAGDYSLFPIAPDEFSKRFGELACLRGFNLTMPHKQAVIELLDELDESARIYQSVNTVANKNGRLIGYNTDCTGFRQALASHDIPLAGQVCVLGAGGVGRMFAIESARAGAHVTIAVRKSSAARAQDLAAELTKRFGVSAQAVDIGSLRGGFDLVINGTPAGMYPNADGSPLQPGVVGRCGALFDSIYNPSPTRLMKEAREAGVKTAGGMHMLVWQAAQAHACWNGTQFTPAQMQPIIEQAQRLASGGAGGAKT